MTKACPIVEQVGNLLNVLKIHSGQFVRGKLEHGKRKACFSLNPLMADGGIQPSGPPLYGPRFFDSDAALEQNIAAQVSKQPDLGGKYFAMPVEEWVMGQKLHGSGKLLGNLLAERPKLFASSPEPMSNMPTKWVLTLNADEPVDVALNRNRDGISEDCFMTTAGDLTRNGFGQMHFERTAGVTVFVDDREIFSRIAETLN